MLNIVIQESDLFFRQGLQCFFTDFFLFEFNQGIHFNFEFTHDTVRMADIIVLPLCPGEVFTCIPELQSRTRGIVIGLVDDAFRTPASPSCFQDILFIARRTSLMQVREALNITWQKTQLTGFSGDKNACSGCQHKTLSMQQMRIMVNLYKGLSVTQIADKLKVSCKTIFTHKYMVMQKFDLRSDYELMILLNKLAERNTHQNIFRDCFLNNSRTCDVAEEMIF
ncbi:helix-turn-helix transcriptional regulator [Enterobacter mori]|uniref:Helix-turn-helix transcriptional regulator n=1 Tax=Enterobacter mori TaxID=539813 RepID=A0A7T0H132_9ENTR|nr:LuxR family transcriptional regulator [Enterobacter mori]QPK02727.1 helix-turn-helix transcriptional regulator [Enterobacter mori]